MMNRFALIGIIFGVTFMPMAALAADEEPSIYCWCKKTDSTCENHRTNDAPAGSKLALLCAGATGTNIQDTTSCSAYCNYRGMRAVHCETTYNPYNTSDSTADEANRCTPSVAPPPEATEVEGGGMGDGGEDRTSPADFELRNPIGSTDLRVIISRLIRAVLGVVGALFLAMFVYGGVMWMTAGESKRIDTAKKTLVNAVIGMVIVAFSYSIVSLVFSFAGQVAGG